MNRRRREVSPSSLFAGLLGHIFVSVPLLLYVLSSIDGRIVFYVLFFSFQLYVCTLVCLALLSHEEVIAPLVIRLLRLFSVFCWGGICFMVYALVGSIVFARIQRGPFHPPKTSPAITAARTVERCPPTSLAIPPIPPHSRQKTSPSMTSGEKTLNLREDFTEADKRAAGA